MPTGIDFLHIREEHVYRQEVSPADVEHIRRIVTSSGIFPPEEIAIAIELIEERLKRGPASGYHFVFFEVAGHVLAYTCYGQIGLTQGSYDIYWIAVEQSERGKGYGEKLLLETERIITELGGRKTYLETSSKDEYQGTRRFYEKCGYTAEAVIRDFYADGDHKYVFSKRLQAGS